MYVLFSKNLCLEKTYENNIQKTKKAKVNIKKHIKTNRISYYKNRDEIHIR